MTVVDLSKYQHEIAASTFTAWRSTVTRVILKCGGGDSGRYQDSLFDTNLANARVAGMPVDAYWFNGTTDPVQDAVFAHSVIPKGMRIWWDVENEGSMPHWGDSSLNAAAGQGQTLGHPAGAYMSSSVTFGGWSTSNWMPLWVANYSASSVPAVGGGWKAVLWQYTSTGREPGYNGNLDISEVQQGWADLSSTPIIDPLGGVLLPVFLQHPDKSIGYVSDAGELDVITDVNEMEALIATGIVKKDPIVLPNPQIWDLLLKRTNRLNAADNPSVTVDFAPVLAAIKAIPASSGGSVDLSPVLAAIAKIQPGVTASAVADEIATRLDS